MSYNRKRVASALRASGWGFAIAVLFVTSAMAGDEEKATVSGRNSKIQLSGVGWATYRYQLAMDVNSATLGRHLTSVGAKDMNRFDMDRVYLTGDYAFDDRYSWQTTLEMTNVDGDRKIYLKRAFLKVKNPFAIANTFAQMGQIAHVMTPSIEKTWGYRSVAKIGIDRFLSVSTTWNGLGFGFSGGGGLVDAELAIANENAYDKPNPTKYKTFQGRVTLTPLPTNEALKGLKIGIWGQMNSSAPPAADSHTYTISRLPTKPDTTITLTAGHQPSASDNQNLWFGVFPSFQAGKLTVACGFDRKRDKTPTHAWPASFPFPDLSGIPTEVKTKTLQLLSGWVAYDVTPRIRSFARIEQWDPNTDVDNDGLTNINAGLSHVMIKGVRSIVDVEYTKFQEPKDGNGATVKLDPDVTLSARLEVTL